MDNISWFLATMHQAIGHDKTAAYIGQPPGDKRDCIVCWFEAGQVTREQVEAYFTAVERGVEIMTEQERQAWNAAVEAVQHHAGVGVDGVAGRDELRERFLTDVHQRIMADDDYQGRTH
jgi:hypothetical protein